MLTVMEATMKASAFVTLVMLEILIAKAVKNTVIAVKKFMHSSSTPTRDLSVQVTGCVGSSNKYDAISYMVELPEWYFCPQKWPKLFIKCHNGK